MCMPCSLIKPRGYKIVLNIDFYTEMIGLLNGTICGLGMIWPWNEVTINQMLLLYFIENSYA